MKLAILAPAFVFIASCTGNKNSAEPVVIDVNEIATEQNIPRVLMEEMESEIQTESKSVTPLFFFTPLTVEFSEKTPGVLKSPLLRFNFPKGGGQIDLKDVITGDGTYFMSFPSEQFENLPELVHLYFVSNSPVTEIQRESFGLGCGKWIDLKSSFKKLTKSDFLKLNSTDLRHLFVSAGTYVFAFRQGTQVSLTQLTITDSRHVKALCLGENRNGK
jgi:hypothetical protein